MGVEQKDCGPGVQIMAVWIKSDSDKFMDEAYLKKFLDDVILELDMTIIYPSIAVTLPLKDYVDPHGRIPDQGDKGISLIAMISESHLALHTWPTYGKAFLEIASCKDFYSGEVVNIIKEYFPGCTLKLHDLWM